MGAVAKYAKLLHGALMPVPGLGTYTSTGDVMKATIDYALFTGYRHIDTASAYNNETDIGIALRDNLKQSVIKREDVFITTKVPANEVGSDKQILECVEQSLEAFKVTKVDMLLVHTPWTCELKRDENGLLLLDERGNKIREDTATDLVDVWRGMEVVQELGKAAAIGVSNFNCAQLDRIWRESKIKPSNLQLECHPYLQQDLLRSYCRSKGIVVTAYSPLGAPGKPLYNHPKEKFTNAVPLLDHPQITGMADEVGCTPAQLILNYLTTSLNVVPLPKSVSPDRLDENLNFLKFSLSDKQREVIKKLEKGIKYFHFPYALDHPHYDDSQPY